VKNPNERYLARLAFWLRAGGSDGAGTISILSDVRTHLADSGESPYEAFGPPRSYAKEFRSRSRWSWSRRAAGVIALVAVVATCFFAADDVAHLGTQRPLWWSVPQWVYVVTTIVLLLLGWQSLLYFTGRPLTSLALESDVGHAWQLQRARRRWVSLALLVAVVASSGTWGAVLGHAFVDAPKLRIANYVHSSTGVIGNSNDTSVSVRTVVFLRAPGPWTSINMVAMSKAQDPNGLVLSSFQGFGSLSQALRVAKNNDWSLSADQAPGFTLHYGSYYVLTWTGALYSALDYQFPPTQENLVLTYLVAGVGLKTLKIPLAVNS
jgi:hypothetical protein